MGESSDLAETVNSLIDRVNSLEIDNEDLRIRVEKLERHFCEIQKSQKVKPPVPPKPLKLLNGTESIKDKISTLDEKLKGKEELNSSLREKVDIIEKKVKKVPPPVPQKPPKKERLESLQIKIPEISFQDEIKLKNSPVAKYFQKDDNLPYTLFPLKPEITLKRSLSVTSDKSSVKNKTNSLEREYSPLVNSIVETVKVEKDVYDMPMFKNFRASFMNTLSEKMDIKRTPSITSFSSFSSETSQTSSKTSDLHHENVIHCFPEYDYILKRIEAIENCLPAEEVMKKENGNFNLTAIVASTLATALVNVDESPDENKICETKDASHEKDHEIKRGHILSEMLETERIYVSELGSIIQGYKVPLASVPELEMDVMFGNFEEIYNFHNELFLQDLENCIGTTELVALCFTHRKEKLHKLYSTYCQNIARSERYRQIIGDHPLLKSCQQKLGHKLPLAAYLLKPVQRITKYQLLLKELLSYSEGKHWCGELQDAHECMLLVLKCVNDSMYQLAVTGYRGDLSDLGDLLMQGPFSVWTENKKEKWGELRLAMKPMQRHLFLYQKALMFCKKTEVNNKEIYQFKKLIMMSDVGMTENVKGDAKTFEIWLTGRSEVHRIQAADAAQKTAWIEQIKVLLLQQLTQLKLQQHTAKQNRSMSLDHYQSRSSLRSSLNTDELAKAAPSDEEVASFSDCSNSDDEETFSNQVHDQPIIIPYSQGSRYRVLADHNAVSHSELSLKENDLVTLLKVGWAGWWYVRLYGASDNLRREGWVPAAYLEHCSRKSSRSCQSVTSDTSSH